MGLKWGVEEDLVYWLVREYLNHNPTLRLEAKAELQRLGIIVIEDTAMTGMQVDIVPVNALNMSTIDPLLQLPGCRSVGPTHFIINMDYAFGAQAAGIMNTLITTFGRAIRSVNVMGKAGGLVGSRGDIQLATHVLLSKSALTTEDYLDEFRRCGNADFEAKELQQLAGTLPKVHRGPVLTIPGTIMQNHALLRFYREIWQCVGVEMEGSYFARQVIDSCKAGLLNENAIKMRFAYYSSDLPLLSGEASLSSPMKPNEEMPPLYAIQRLVLRRILNV